ncbi:uroporphyrinogen-III C-methyltransferase [Martelella alba]|uniref:Uroporphyrinogen-III C-methyltransferase n=1 Tax=Martelella alba TaxID=2590451 RepID=A0ABY2SGD6_9HYPH|nr:uroporphyrinogen-III C-methyltransferase [Martelella alba]TKI04178.1 uroporphyrinogen-III C-methyltransferase [Martelella alba]
MTEHSTPTPQQDNAAAAAVSDRPEQTASRPSGGGRRGTTAMILAVVAILIALLLAAALYFHDTRREKAQSAATEQLQSSLDGLRQAQQQQQQQYQTALRRQEQALDDARRQADAQARQIGELQDKIATISGADANTWLLAQADFLIKLAGRKLWSDQDIVTAGALLKSADASLADMNDPSLMPVRRAITDDIASLSSVSQIDFDGIILKVNQLANQVDNLRLADNDSDEAPMDSDGDSKLSGSVRQWRQNLSKSWHNFLNDFITIRRRDTGAEPLLAPNQDVYLRENIRSRLLIAAQAVPRHQTDIFQQSLETVATWVRAYFDTNDAATRAFLTEVDSLSQQSVSLDVPDHLSSQPIMDKLMQTRVRNLLAQPAAPASQGE